MAVLSIIIPVYNEAEYIQTCLESIASQTYQDLEIVIVDDGSTDHTEARIRSFCEEHKELRIRYLKEQNQGSSCAVYTGLQAACGEMIGFSDGDDWVEPEHFEKLLAAMKAAEADIACCGFYLEYPHRPGRKGRRSGIAYPAVLDAQTARRYLFQRTEVYAYRWNKVFRASLLTDWTPVPGTMIGEDLQMVLSALEKSEKVVVTKDCTYHYRIHRQSITQQGYGLPWKKGYEQYEVLRLQPDRSAMEQVFLERYLMLEYMAVLLRMYRNQNRDEELEQAILAYVKEHRREYLQHSHDGWMAKAFAGIIGKRVSSLLYHVWPLFRLPGRQEDI